MEHELRLISSMATRALLAELAADYAREPGGRRVALEAVGGVDAARRVRDGEAFDAVVLAAKAIDELIAAGRIVAGSRVDLVRSGVAVAVRSGAPRPAIGSEDALRRAVLAAPALAYSTGPSGVHLQQVFERWGIAAEIAPRIVQAPPGVPVGTLVADGRVALGFQQLSELMHLPGIDVVGPLPPGVQIVTTFSGGVASASREPDAVRALLEWMAGPAGAAARARHGMEAA
jgi:molybdate transport system substrate-binding protein